MKDKDLLKALMKDGREVIRVSGRRSDRGDTNSWPGCSHRTAEQNIEKDGAEISPAPIKGGFYAVRLSCHFSS